jgi:predicted ABC-type ATPase
MWIVAGPNGSGKTSIASDPRVATLLERATRLCADDIAKQIATSRGVPVDRAISLNAAQITDQAVDGHIAAGTDFIVESVLSTKKYRSRIRAARARGFKIGLIFVYLRKPLLNVIRVKDRVASGGHHVPPEDVIRRWSKSIRNGGVFGARSDFVMVFDNSSLDGPIRVLQKDLASDSCSAYAESGCDLVDEVFVTTIKRLSRVSKPFT